MKLAKKIREELKENPYRMAGRMNKTCQGYQVLERKTLSPNLKDLLALRDLAISELGWSDTEFLDELKKELKIKKSR